MFMLSIVAESGTAQIFISVRMNENGYISAKTWFINIGVGVGGVGVGIHKYVASALSRSACKFCKKR